MAKAKKKAKKKASKKADKEADAAAEVEVEQPAVAEAEEAAEEVAEEVVEEVVEFVEDATAPLWYWGTGRRKTAVARVRIRPGSGLVSINKKPLDEYFRIDRHRRAAVTPLGTARLEGRVDVFANISGGGITGQAEAMVMGLARALVKLDSGVESALRTAGHLTRDSRMVERKKYGRRGARRKFQYSKR